MKRPGRMGAAWLSLLLGSLPLFGELGFQAAIGRARNEGVGHPAHGFLQPSLETGFGWQFGIAYCRQIGSTQLLRLEGLYALKGDKTTQDLWIVPDGGMYRVKTPCTIQARYNYVEVPLILEQYLNRSRQGFHLLAGAYVGWLLGARMSGLEGDNWRFFGDDYSRIKSFDYGWILGLGTRASQKRSWRADIDFRLEYGMAQLARDGFFQNHGSGDSNNMALLVSLAVVKGGKKAATRQNTERKKGDAHLEACSK